MKFYWILVEYCCGARHTARNDWVRPLYFTSEPESFYVIEKPNEDNLSSVTLDCSAESLQGLKTNSADIKWTKDEAFIDYQSFNDHIIKFV